MPSDRDDAALEALDESVDLGALPSYIGYVLRRAQLAVFQDVIRALAEVDLRPAQFAVLTLVDANPGIVQSRACDALAIQKANFVPMLAELERRGLTRRVPVDGRSNGVFLTPKGRALLKRARTLHARHHARIAAVIGERDQRQLLATLERITALFT